MNTTAQFNAEHNSNVRQNVMTRFLIVGDSVQSLFENIGKARNLAHFHLETLDKYPDTLGAWTDETNGEVYVDYGKWANLDYNDNAKLAIARIARATNQVCILVRLFGTYWLVFGDWRKHPVYLGNSTEPLNHARNFTYFHKIEPKQGESYNETVLAHLHQTAINLTEYAENFTLNARTGDVWGITQE